MELKTDRCPLCDELKPVTFVFCNYCLKKHKKDICDPKCDLFAKKRYRHWWSPVIHWLGRKIDNL